MKVNERVLFYCSINFRVILLHMKPHNKTFMAEKYKQVVMFYFIYETKSATKPHVTLTVT